MPLYQAACRICTHEHDYIETMARCHIVPKCPKCGGKSDKIIGVPPAVYGDLNVWDTENGGKGRWNRQLKQFTTSVKDTEQKAAARGWCALHKG